jgi:hypothetical protein
MCSPLPIAERDAITDLCDAQPPHSGGSSASSFLASEEYQTNDGVVPLPPMQYVSATSAQGTIRFQRILFQDDWNASPVRQRQEDPPIP